MTWKKSILLALCLATASVALTDAVDGYLPYKKLLAQDFRIDDRAYPEFGIYTACFLKCRYETRIERSGRNFVMKVSKWVVDSGFDRNGSSRKSWLEDVEATLSHEQGHLDLNEIHARALARRAFSGLPIGQGPNPQAAYRDLLQKLEKLVQWACNENRADQARYDNQTRGGLDREMQAKWTESIQARLKGAGIQPPPNS